MWDQKLEIFGWKRCFVSIWWTVLPILFCNSLLKQVQVKWQQLKANSSKIIGLKTGYMNDRISSPPFLWNLFFSFFVCQLSTFDEKRTISMASAVREQMFLFQLRSWHYQVTRIGSGRLQPGVVLTRLARIFGRFLRHGFPGIRNLAHLRNIFTSSRNSLLGIMITTFLKTKTCSETEGFFARFLDENILLWRFWQLRRIQRDGGLGHYGSPLASCRAMGHGLLRFALPRFLLMVHLRVEVCETLRIHECRWKLYNILIQWDCENHAP